MVCKGFWLAGCKAGRKRDRDFVQRSEWSEGIRVRVFRQREQQAKRKTFDVGRAWQRKNRAASLAGFELGIVMGRENGIKCGSGRWEPDVEDHKEFRFYSERYCSPPEKFE